MPEGCTFIQKDLGSLEKWADRNLIKFNKCSVLHLGRNNPMHEYGLGCTQLESSSVENNLGSWWIHSSVQVCRLLQGIFALRLTSVWTWNQAMKGLKTSDLTKDSNLKFWPCFMQCLETTVLSWRRIWGGGGDIYFIRRSKFKFR